MEHVNELGNPFSYYNTNKDVKAGLSLMKIFETLQSHRKIEMREPDTKHRDNRTPSAIDNDVSLLSATPSEPKSKFR